MRHPRPASIPNNRARLRAATTPAHERSERLWIGPAGFPSIERYRQFLRALLVVHCRLGHPAAEMRGAEEAVDEARRIDALTHDLDGERPAVVPQIPDSISEAWGVGYALNGAALGGASMLKQGAVPPDWPHAYFSVGQDDVRWGKLKDFFSALNAATLDMAAATAGASAVFAVLAAQAQVEPSPRARGEAPCTTG